MMSGSGTVAPMRLALLGGLVLTSPACGSGVECRTELTAAGGSWTGSARGEAEDRQARHGSVRDACRQMCAATKAQAIDACAASCAADADAGKVGARTTCARR